jgi:hypothetical protein
MDLEPVALPRPLEAGLATRSHKVRSHTTKRCDALQGRRQAVLTIESPRKNQRNLAVEGFRAYAAANSLHGSRSLLSSMNGYHKSDFISSRASDVPLQHLELDSYNHWNYVDLYGIYPGSWHAIVLALLVRSVQRLWFETSAKARRTIILPMYTLS